MTLGRNITEDNNRFYLTIVFDGETQHRQWGFDTYRKAKLAMTKALKNGATWFDPHTDPTI
jgi:hypothetical protein